MTSFFNRILISSAALALAGSVGFAQTAEDLRLTIGKSIVIDYPSDIRQVYTSNPETNNSATNAQISETGTQISSPSAYSAPLVQPGGGCNFTGC